MRSWISSNSFAHSSPGRSSPITRAVAPLGFPGSPSRTTGSSTSPRSGCQTECGTKLCLSKVHSQSSKIRRRPSSATQTTSRRPSAASDSINRASSPARLSDCRSWRTRRVIGQEVYIRGGRSFLDTRSKLAETREHAGIAFHRDVPGTQLWLYNASGTRHVEHNYATWHSTGIAPRSGSTGSEGGRRSCVQRGHSPSGFPLMTALPVRRWVARGGPEGRR